MTPFDARLATVLVVSGMIRMLSGTLVSIDDAPPGKLMIRAERQFQTFAVAQGAVIERESRFVGREQVTTARIKLSDLTPGEDIELEIDAEARVTKARAVANLERATVRSARGRTVVLEDGRTLTIGSVLRFVTAEGRPSATTTVQPGETVILFHHPRTGNIYRFDAEAARHRPR